MPAIRCRAAFISDIHLGTRGCQAQRLLDFIRDLDCETLYLVGDIIDGWKMKSGIYWPQSHNDVVQKILRLARKGVRVVYVPGNHDERLREFCGEHFGGVIVTRDEIHQGADGRRYLVTHGDEFDAIVQNARWLALLGDWSYRALLALNTTLNRVRALCGLGHWSLSAFLKQRVKDAVRYIDRFEETMADEARRRGVQGVICGHIHKAEIRTIGDIIYLNDGDWVESCTALVERHDGVFEIIRWQDSRPVLLSSPRKPSKSSPAYAAAPQSLSAAASAAPSAPPVSG